MPRIPASQKKKPTANSSPKPIEQEPPAPPVKVIERRIETVSVEIPLGEARCNPGPVYHLDFHFDRDQHHTLARIRQGLQDQGARTANGRLVESRPEVIKWLMEQIAKC